MKNSKNKVLFLCRCAVIAALYVVLTFVSSAMGLSYGPIQMRISEALCILPIFTLSAIPGVTLGCFLANLLTGCVSLDIALGTAATFIGALGTYFLRRFKIAAFLSPVISNVLIVPFVLIHAYGVKNSYPFLMLTVGAGEIISVCLFGFILYKFVEKRKNLF